MCFGRPNPVCQPITKRRVVHKVGIIHQFPNEDLHFTVYFFIICQVDLSMTKVGLFDAHGGPF